MLYVMEGDVAGYSELRICWQRNVSVCDFKDCVHSVLDK